MLRHKAKIRSVSYGCISVGKASTFPFSLILHGGQSLRSKNFSASQEILHILWNPKFHYLVHNSPPFLPVLSQINSVSALSPYCFRIHFDIILPSTPTARTSPLPIQFSLIWSPECNLVRRANHEAPV
jgi:hypothetical protein